MKKRHEIGSEFWDVPIGAQGNTIWPDGTRWYGCGRSALQAVIKDIKKTRAIKTVAMPSWCCQTMVGPFIDSGIEVVFYPVFFEHGRLKQELRMDCDVLFLMEYFGYSSDDFGVADYRGIIIRDVTHSIFSRIHRDSDYYFGSLRKWCGVWTGGYAWTMDGHGLPVALCDDGRYVLLRKKAMQMKSCYINGCHQDEKDVAIREKAYLEVYGEAEGILDREACGLGNMAAADRDIVLAKQLDVDSLKLRRRENAQILMDAFMGMLIFPKLENEDCPLFVPILVPNGVRDSLKRYLAESEIYCPVHWQVSGCHRLSRQEKAIYENELSLVCDQRYTGEDMGRMVKLIDDFLKGN